ncbi:MAG: hypothetical protein L0L37_04620 [Lacticaseibacillus paracasei]|nr:hypothetical protein [Lacticaseibacillus paracasei]
MVTFFYQISMGITVFFCTCFLVLFICGGIILFRNDRKFISSRKHAGHEPMRQDHVD